MNKGFSKEELLPLREVYTTRSEFICQKLRKTMKCFNVDKMTGSRLQPGTPVPSPRKAIVKLYTMIHCCLCISQTGGVLDAKLPLVYRVADK
jgi:hypothetical protein